jgi:hypothetical protein
MNKRLSVYFSASSRDEKNYDLYRRITSSIERAGGKVIFNWLTDKKKLSPHEVFHEATKAIRNSDIVVAEIGIPSIGVGQQIAFSLDNKVPVIALVDENAIKPSRFTLGNESKLLSIVRYNSKNLAEQLKEKFGNLRKQRFTKFNFIATKEINNYLETESKKINLSKSQFLRILITEKIKAKN